MMDKPLYDRIEFISSHGSEQGIVTRFFLQIKELANQAFLNENDRHLHLGQYMNVVLTDFTTFYDLYNELKQSFEEFQKGILNGELFKIDERGVAKIDRSLEFKIQTKIKEFFIKGRILLNNLAKSKVIDDEYFCLNDLIIVKDTNFKTNKLKFLAKDKLKRYEYLFDMIEYSRKNFLTTFNQIRADIEHDHFIIPRFKISFLNQNILFEQPMLKERVIMSQIDYYYNSILDFIENIIAYYMGINANINWKGFMTLYQRKTFDYKELKYKFIISPRSNDNTLIDLIFDRI